MIFAGAKRDTRVRVRRNKLKPRTGANAFGRPNREENPAARIRTCSLGRVEGFIVMILHEKGPCELSAPAFLDADLVDGDRGCRCLWFGGFCRMGLGNGRLDNR